MQTVEKYAASIIDVLAVCVAHDKQSLDIQQLDIETSETKALLGSNSLINWTETVQNSY